MTLEIGRGDERVERVLGRQQTRTAGLLGHADQRVVDQPAEMDPAEGRGEPAPAHQMRNLAAHLGPRFGRRRALILQRRRGAGQDLALQGQRPETAGLLHDIGDRGIGAVLGPERLGVDLAGQQQDLFQRPGERGLFHMQGHARALRRRPRRCFAAAGVAGEDSADQSPDTART